MKPPRVPFQVGDRVTVAKVADDDPWLRKYQDRQGVVVERGRHDVLGYARPPVYVAIDFGDRKPVEFLESECSLVHHAQEVA